MTVNINGYTINFVDEGSGQTVLLLHGWASSIDPWVHIIKNLKEQGGFRVIALDFPGCGGSSLPERPLELSDYTDLVVEFCKELNIENPIVFGHSHGGRVALALAGMGLLNIKKAVIFGGAGLKPKSSLKKSVKIASFKTVKFFLTLPVVKNFTADTLNKARAHFGSSDYNNAPEVMRKTLVTLVNSDIRHILKDIKCPTLLIWGSNDTAVPLYLAKIMEKEIPDAGLCVFEGCGHFAFLEKPVDTNIIINSFLK